MGKVIFKSVLFLALLLASSQLLIRPFVYHPFWGDTMYIAKYDEFTASEETKYNTVFVGTSRTFRHTDPAVFDSITGLKSFNFGIDGDGCPSNYMLAKELFESNKMDSVKYLILELFSPSGNLGWETESNTLHTDKVLYRYGLADFYFTTRALLEMPNQPIRELVMDIRSHSINLIESSFRLGFVHRIANAKEKGKSPQYLGPDGNGYLSIDDEIRLHGNDFQLLTRKKFLADSSENRKRADASVNIPDLTSNFDKFDFHKKYINQLQTQCAHNGVLLLLVVHPRMTVKQCDYFHAFLADTTPLKCLTVLDYSNSDLYPQYYDLTNVFDEGHLNSKGAKLFSNKLATDVKFIIDKK